MLKRNLLKTRPTAILFYILPNTEMTNGGMKWNSFFVANACKTMQYNFSSSIKKIVKIIEYGKFIVGGDSYSEISIIEEDYIYLQFILRKRRK